MLETLSIRTNPCKSMHVIASYLPPCGESAAAALTAAALEAAPSAFAAVADAVAVAVALAAVAAAAAGHASMALHMTSLLALEA